MNESLGLMTSFIAMMVDPDFYYTIPDFEGYEAYMNMM